ncbi:hypothetical protein [Paenibacillus sp. sgz5001063]|uniref:hypothetical protein n=1 Tax=Paenibacillus sp. sgz5001063 TaxID=3242474 RepID=UPI0036D22544
MGFDNPMKKKALFYAKIPNCKRYQQKGELVIVIFLMYDAFKQSLNKLAFSTNWRIGWWDEN